MGTERPKAFISLGTLPILAHTLQKFEICPQVDEVIPLVPPGEGVAWTREIVSQCGLQKVSQIMPGGAERQESVFIGLKAIREKTGAVIIHDGARPFVTLDLIQRSLSEARRFQAVAVALPASETVKEVDGENIVLRTVDRRQLWLMQTPQSFDYNLILRAHDEARRDGFVGTDDASLVERLGVPVKIIEGARLNFKITTPEDLVLAEAILKSSSEFRVRSSE
jgi:2-C-methyl-D-erythritol 4-phosphate cytidylyltransferase